MENGDILLWDKEEANKGFRKFVSKMIKWVTKSEVTHVGIFLNGKVYEMEKEGKRQGLVVSKTGLCRLPPKVVISPALLTNIQATEMEKFILFTYSGYNYNALKLVAMLFLVPFKKLFSEVPFDEPHFGEICSVMPDEAYKSIGIDLFPNKLEGYTSPGDFLKLEG